MSGWLRPAMRARWISTWSADTASIARTPRSCVMTTSVAEGLRPQRICRLDSGGGNGREDPGHQSSDDSGSRGGDENLGQKNR